jgi:hypothetical protein
VAVVSGWGRRRACSYEECGTGEGLSVCIVDVYAVALDYEGGNSVVGCLCVRESSGIVGVIVSGGILILDVSFRI